MAAIIRSATRVPRSPVPDARTSRSVLGARSIDSMPQPRALARQQPVSQAGVVAPLPAPAVAAAVAPPPSGAVAAVATRPTPARTPVAAPDQHHGFASTSGGRAPTSSPAHEHTACGPPAPAPGMRRSASRPRGYGVVATHG